RERRRGVRLLLPLDRPDAADEQRGAAEAEAAGLQRRGDRGADRVRRVAGGRAGAAGARPRAGGPGAGWPGLPPQLPGLSQRGGQRWGVELRAGGAQPPRCHPARGRGGDALRSRADAGLRPRHDRRRRAERRGRLRGVLVRSGGPRWPADRTHRAHPRGVRRVARRDGRPAGAGGLDRYPQPGQGDRGTVSDETVLDPHPPAGGDGRRGGGDGGGDGGRGPGPRRARRAEIGTAVAFALAFLGALGLTIIYWLGGQAQAEGVMLTVATGGIGAGIVLWAKHFMPSHDTVEERAPLASPPEDV